MSKEKKTVTIYFAVDKSKSVIEGTNSGNEHGALMKLARWFLPHDWQIDPYDQRTFAKTMCQNGYSIMSVEVDPELLTS